MFSPKSMSNLGRFTGIVYENLKSGNSQDYAQEPQRNCKLMISAFVYDSQRREYRARICKRLWNPGIDSEKSIPPAYVAWRAGTTNRVFVPVRQTGNRFLGSLKGLKIRALSMCQLAKWKTLDLPTICYYDSMIIEIAF